MRKLTLNIRLLIVFSVVLAGFVISDFGFTTTSKSEYTIEMSRAVDLTKKWFEIIKQQKEIRNIHSDAVSNVPNNYMLGDDYTTTTTTLGTLNAKEISTNPEFAALMVRLIRDAGIKEGDKVGVILSGSFPSLSISTLAALQTLKLDAVITSSLGASSYGANQEGASWLDMETWIIENGGLTYHSSMVSKGAENDFGLGLSDEGNILLEKTAQRNKRTLYSPLSLSQAISDRVNLFTSNKITLLINIGGNQAAMGRCTHSVSIPNGFNENIPLCDDKERGVIQEMNAVGIPFINLLNIKELAAGYNMDITPGIQYSASPNLFTEIHKNSAIMMISLITSLLSVIVLIPKKNGT
ncbi:MAG: poly-gamma-glutamate system protein [Bacteroidales bacterium]|nr:poly-gamma-glutamate system protein [Bacteroidales bacterium]